MTIPRELKIRENQLTQFPVKEFKCEDHRTIRFSTYEGAVTIYAKDRRSIQIGFRAGEIYCDQSSYSEGSKATPMQRVPTQSLLVDFTIVIDSGSVEVFALDGSVVFSNRTPYEMEFESFAEYGEVLTCEYFNLERELVSE